MILGYTYYNLNYFCQAVKNLKIAAKHLLKLINIEDS